MVTTAPEIGGSSVTVVRHVHVEFEVDSGDVVVVDRRVEEA